jgi:hypothetical protein
MKGKKKINIMLCNMNQEKPNTCGSCEHTRNAYGLVALHCDMYIDHKKLTPHICKDDSKVRSWYIACKYYKKG